MRITLTQLWQAGVTFVTAAGLLLAPVSSATAGETGPAGQTGPASQTIGTQAFAAPAGYIVHGAHISPVDTYPTEITGFETNTGKDLGIVMYFRPWDRQDILVPGSVNEVGPCDDGFLPRKVNDVAKPGAVNGRTIMITWEPLSILASPGPADYDNILNGDYNTLIDNCAKQLANWYNQTFIIRFMHEMNITTSVWWAGHDYNQKTDGSGEGDTAKFIQTWRYVWQRFYNAQQTAGHHNVQWLWAPNWGSNPADAWNDMHNYYPGDSYVDWIGLSGYNWNGYKGYTAPDSYEYLYDAVLTDLQCRYAKPIVHAEIGSTEQLTQSKSGWLADAYTRMQTYPLLRAVVWFNDYAYHNLDEADLRVATTKNYFYNGTQANYLATPLGGSGNVVSAYQTAVADASFTPTFDSSKLLNPPMTRCAGDAVSANGVLSARPASAVVARVGQTSVAFEVGALGLSADTTFTVSGCPAGATCRFSSGSGTSATQAAPWSKDTLTVQTTGSASLGTATLTITGGGASVAVPLTVSPQLYLLFLPSMQKN
ncbi:MAG: hypothetical protein KA764_07475 [Anaerolineales bacterium]|nr:hypothetical protein [Anaerolineales bacterium]